MPDSVRLPIFLKGTKEIIIGHDFLKLVIIDRAKKMNAIVILGKILFMIFDSSYNAGSKALAIFLGWHKECTSHKIAHWDQQRASTSPTHSPPHDLKSQQDPSHGKI
jgi:hypothetical protein